MLAHRQAANFPVKEASLPAGQPPAQPEGTPALPDGVRISHRVP